MQMSEITFVTMMKSHDLSLRVFSTRRKGASCVLKQTHDNARTSWV